MLAEASKIINIFYSYARQDRALRDELDKHLDTLRRSGQIKNWHDREISPGVEWEKEIDSFLSTSDIVLLLVSPDFMASDYCYGVEMERAMRRHATGDARVIPILLRPVGYEDAPFSKLQSLPTNVQAITSWSNRDEAFADVAKGIRKAIKEVLIERESKFQRGDVSSNGSASQRTKEQWLDVGDAHYDAKRYEEALEAYKHVLQIDPNCLSALIYKSWTLYYLKRYEEALKVSEYTLQIDPENSTVWNDKGNALHNLKRHHEAIVAYEQALQFNPNYVVALSNKGNSLYQRSRYKEALDFYEQALRIDSKYALAYSGKGDVLYSFYHNKEALAAYDEALQCDPTMGYAYYQKGKILDRLGSSQEAQQAFKKAKELGYNA